jgi:putrescine aminotransferase
MLEPERPQDALIEDFASYVSPAKVAAYRGLGFAVVPGRREGCRVWDWDGKRSYINLRSSGGVFNLGHRPLRVIAALKEALERFDIGDHILMSGPRAALARRLAKLTPGDITYTVFGVGGGEAIDLAIKLARGYTRRPGIIAVKGGYHGHTGFAVAATDEPSERFGPVAPGFSHVPFADIDAMDAAIGDETAAVIMETIPATSGMPIPPPEYYPDLRKLCDDRGALLILDEVQAGLGRTGRLWAIDEWGVVPDIMVLGKGMSGAIYPLSATCFRPKLQSFFDEDPFVHVSTYGGADLGCVVTMAMLDQITEPGFLEHVREMAGRFETGLAALREKYPQAVREVRQRGLMIGFETADPRGGPWLVQALINHGVISLFSNHNTATLQIMPPLIISADEVDEVLDALDLSLGEIAPRMASEGAKGGA